MVIEKLGPDIAQRIVKALTLNSIPVVPESDIDFDSDKHTFICEVPKHLRHLYLLLMAVEKESQMASELYEEALEISQSPTNFLHEAEINLLDALERSSLVNAIFFNSLEQHVSSKMNLDKYDVLCICGNWRFVGYNWSDSEKILEQIFLDKLHVNDARH